MPWMAVGGLAALGGGLLAAQASSDAAAAAQQALQQAREIIGGVTVPSAEQMQIVLQKLHSAGVLTPELQQALSQKSSTLKDIQTDPTTTSAQKQALLQLMQSGRTGLTATDRAALAQVEGGLQQQNKANQESVMQNMAARGMGGSGSELAARLAASQGAAQIANQQGNQIASQASQNALGAIAQSGQLAGQMNQQQFGQQSQIAQAQDAINRFNTQNAQQVQAQNVGTQNQAQAANLQNKQDIMNQNTALANQQKQYNSQMIQQNYNNQLQKAMASAGMGVPMANVSMQAGQNAANMYSGMGAGLGQAAGAYGNYQLGQQYLNKMPDKSGAQMDYSYMNQGGVIDETDHVPSNALQESQGGMIPGMLEGGKVSGKAKVKGDSPKNDTVPTMLSPGEGVIPRSYMQDAEKAKAFIEGLIKGKIVSGVNMAEWNTPLKDEEELKDLDPTITSAMSMLPPVDEVNDADFNKAIPPMEETIPTRSLANLDDSEASEIAPTASEEKAPSQYQELLARYNEMSKGGGMHDAAALQNQMQLNAGLTNAFTTMAEAGGHRPINRGAIQGMEQQAQMPMQMEMAKRQQLGQDIKESQNLAGMKMTEEKANPNSATSKAYQDFAAKIGMPQNGRSAADIEKIMPLMEKYQQAQESAKQRALYRELALGEKKTQQQRQAETQTDQFLNGARAEKSTQLAEMDAYNTKKIHDVLNQYGGDLNKVETNMVPVLISEVAKVAKGGTPDAQEMAKMMPSSVMNWIQVHKGKALNEAEAAYAKSFLQPYISYADEIGKNARKTITERYGRILAARAPLMSPEATAIRKQEYLGRFGAADEAPANADPKIAAWAKQYGKSYSEATEILKRRGYNGGQ